MNKFYLIVALILMLCIGCEWRLKPNSVDSDNAFAVERYDRVQSLYLTTGDFSALQQMSTNYPIQTRTLIEDVLKIGNVNDPEINTKFLNFYQDTTLQAIINEAEQQYANMDDINNDFNKAFHCLKTLFPNMKTPQVYAQIGSLDQSVIVGENIIGFSLDKYLGKNYSLYKKFYPEEQRALMTRQMIVPDCILFYLLSLYPLPHDHKATQQQCDLHMGKIQWIVNKVIGRHVFGNKYVATVTRYMKKHKGVTEHEMLTLPITDDLSD